MAQRHAHFRFMDLPGELRNQIYQELLCGFNYTCYLSGYPNELERILRQEPRPNGINQVAHTVNTSILLVNRTTNREAYGVMVKTNRFIRIKSCDPRFSSFLLWSQLPVVTMDRRLVAQFEGYVLQMCSGTSLEPDYHASSPLFDLMILGRDWDAFCRGFSKMICTEDIPWIHLQTDVISKAASSNFLRLIENNFLRMTQASLINSFGGYMRGIRDIAIEGKNLVSSTAPIISQVKATPWVDSPEWYLNLEKQCQIAEELRMRNEFLKASTIFLEVDNSNGFALYGGSPALRERKRILTFTCRVGIALCSIHYLESAPESFQDSSYQELGEYALNLLEDEGVNRYKGIWLAKQYLLFSRIARLLGRRIKHYAMESSVTSIGRILDAARNLDPDSQEISDEQEQYLEWAQSILDGNNAE